MHTYRWVPIGASRVTRSKKGRGGLTSRDIRRWGSVKSVLPLNSGRDRGNKDEQLVDAWKRLVKSMADKEGITLDQAETRTRKFFPELYELYEKARRQREG